MKPDRNKFILLKQDIEIIPSYTVPKLARSHGVDKQSPTFSPRSHAVAMIFTHSSTALSPNEVCDTLRCHSGALSTVRNAVHPRAETAFPCKLNGSVLF